MFDQTLKPLLESGLINEDTHRAINEAWESKLTEAREQIATEMRAEYANKYEHDKNVMVDALDRMVTEGLKQEVLEFKRDQKAMAEDRVRAKRELQETAKKFNKFLMQSLAEEIKELRADRQNAKDAAKKLERFVIEGLAREIKEFSQDKKALVETRVKLIAEATERLKTLKKRFVMETAAKLNDQLSTQLTRELSQLKEDITEAKKSQFGRRLFEAFAVEFSNTHLNSKAETRRLMKTMKRQESKLAEAVKIADDAKKLIESKEREIRMIKENNVRSRTMTELLSTLNEEKAEVMRSLLESVQTPMLKTAFEKYLPSVLNTGTIPGTDVKQTRRPIVESTVVTGDKSAKTDLDSDERDNVIALKRLAGL